MLPGMTPLDDNLNRVVYNMEQGYPEESAPAASGGFGADTPELGEAGEKLRKEGALDEALDEDNKP